MILKAFYFSDLGNYRKINEDCILLDKHIFQPQNMKTYEYMILNSRNPFVAIADGMGGHDKGELASYSTLSFLKENMESNPPFKEIRNILYRSKTYLNEIAESNNSPGLGTTLSGIYFYEGIAYIYNIGDSRVYRVRKRKLERLTDDHTEVFELFQSGKISEDEIRTHKGKNLLTAALVGDFSNQKPNISEKNISLRIGDIFFLCSDGLWEGIPQTHFEKLFLENSSEETICSELINFSLKYAGLDNISFILLKIVDI